MGIIGYIFSLIIVGLIVGALGRLVVPGPNPMGVGKTIGIGLIGAFVGSLVGGLLGLGFFTIVLEVAAAAGVVYVVGGRSGRLAAGSRRS